ncbi:hypothetical protein HY489_05825 [Candidatus Woesearchaeota archaeon]|nr:hypothetical protein [Candidatus Woesearchaeota archaeon]
MQAEDIIGLFLTYSAELDSAIRTHKLFEPFFTKRFNGRTIDQLRAAHAAYHHVSAGYTHWTVPLLRAGGEALANGDAEDKACSKAYVKNANDEIDHRGHYGHDRWALNDIQAIGFPEHLAHSPAPVIVNGKYKQFMVDNANLHPYGGLGAKGVLEHLAIHVSGDFCEGFRASGIPNIENGLVFLAQHGILDLDHTKSGNDAVRSISSPAKLEQIAEGSRITREQYHLFLGAMNESYEFFLRSLQTQRNT